jgi:hypothetical protein
MGVRPFVGFACFSASVERLITQGAIVFQTALNMNDFSEAKIFELQFFTHRVHHNLAAALQAAE